MEKVKFANKLKKIGILGGTFNPVHIGHLAIADTVRDRLKLDHVIFIPSFWPPHKSRRGILSVELRLKMLRKAVESYPEYSVCDFEAKRQGKSFTINTIHYLKTIYPNAKFYFIIGSDMLNGLSKWKSIDVLSQMMTFVAIQRKGFERVVTDYKVKFLPVLNLGISSSYIRQSIRKQYSVRHLLPENVYKFILKKNLYQKS